MSEANGHDGERNPTTGQFLPGNRTGRLGGRPPGVDFRRVVAERCDGSAFSLEERLWRVFETLWGRAVDGDVQAAKLLLDRLVDADAVRLQGGIALTVVTSVPNDPEP